MAINLGSPLVPDRRQGGLECFRMEGTGMASGAMVGSSVLGGSKMGRGRMRYLSASKVG